MGMVRLVGRSLWTFVCNKRSGCMWMHCGRRVFGLGLMVATFTCVGMIA